MGEADLTHNRGLPRPPFNVIVSNVPGSPDPLYWHGTRVDAAYPLSVPVDGQALNITCPSTADIIALGRALDISSVGGGTSACAG